MSKFCNSCLQLVKYQNLPNEINLGKQGVVKKKKKAAMAYGLPGVDLRFLARRGCSTPKTRHVPKTRHARGVRGCPPRKVLKCKVLSCILAYFGTQFDLDFLVILRQLCCNFLLHRK